MASNNRSVRSGGGIDSNKRVEIGVRYGGPRREVNKVAVSRLGAMIGSHATNNPKVLNTKLEPFYGKTVPSVPLGNQVAGNVGPGGPGTGRTLYRAGYQGPTPAPQAMSVGRNTLSEYGPDVPGKGRGR